MTRRRPNTGTIERLPSGKWRARRKVGGKYRTIGEPQPTPEAAELLLKTELDTETAATSAPCLGRFATAFLRMRETLVKDHANECNRWELYIAHDPIATIPFTDMKRADVKRWLDRLRARGLGVQTRKNALSLLRVALTEAVDRELMPSNPAQGVRLHRSEQGRTHEGWTYLDPDEQLSLLRAVDSDEWHAVAFAMSTGLRNSEQWSLRKADIDMDSRIITVRYGGKDLSTKSGKIRRVPMIDLALEAASIALEGPSAFAFPAPRTRKRRAAKSHPSRWGRWLERAGITRRVRWYDLRHTCATSLIAGWWGRKWSKEEVQQMLGHSSVTVTERYAHLVDDSLNNAVELTQFHGGKGHGAQVSENIGASYQNRTDHLRFTKPYGLGGFSGLALEEFLRRDSEVPSANRADLIAATRAAVRASQDPDAIAEVRALLSRVADRAGFADLRDAEAEER